MRFVWKLLVKIQVYIECNSRPTQNTTTPECLVLGLLYRLFPAMNCSSSDLVPLLVDSRRQGGPRQGGPRERIFL